MSTPGGRSFNTEVIDLLVAAGVTQLACVNTDTARSYTFLLEKGRSFALEVQAVCDSGSPDLKIELEVGGSEPGTEGASDTDFVIPRAIGGASNPDCILDNNCNTQLVRFYPLPPVVAPLQRFLFTGVGSNSATTRITRLKVHQIQN